ncbi:Ragulator complex protein LAMTOR5 [Cinara cedri]|uniref:Late endosomal/lysosomal adaptor and MAPK and MTOR activator 5 n=1 Tax=Cinara cedri TaxID=506608 RepID=A0A5E4M6T7_9HEMI|nr:Ragulator complex protein LAMTOR5 [Cinara cedri]
MEQSVLDEVSQLQSEHNVVGVLVSDNRGLCIFSSGGVKSDVSGHITFIANHISKLDTNEPYPTIVLKSDNKSCLIKGCENSCVSVLYENKQ